MAEHLKESRFSPMALAFSISGLEWHALPEGNTRLNTVLFQIFIALSFGFRVLLAQRWPISGDEALVIKDFPGWLNLSSSSILPMRWGVICLFFVFLVLWGNFLRRKNGSINLIPLIIFHLFPLGLFSGALINIFPIIGIVFMGSLLAYQSGKKPFYRYLPFLFIGLMSVIEPGVSLLIPGLLMLEAQRCGISSTWSKGIWLLCTVFFLFLFISDLTSSSVTFWNELSFEEWVLFVGLSFVGTLHGLSKKDVNPKEKNEFPWLIFLIPMGGFLFVCPQSSLPIFIPLFICLWLSFLHELWLKECKGKSALTWLTLSFVCIVHGNSGAIERQGEKYDQLSEQQGIANKAEEFLGSVPILLLCDNPSLSALLELTLGRTVLTYPAKGSNTSYRHLGQSGVWIHSSLELGEEYKTPHLEGRRIWKEIQMQQNQRFSVLLYEKFDRLILPF